MAIEEVATDNLPIDNVPGAQLLEDTPGEETLDPQMPDLTCTPDPTKMCAHVQVVEVENASRKAYG